MTPLGAFFCLALGILGTAVSIYSFGYLRDMEGRRNLGALGFFYNILFLSLTLVFTASNAFFFLVAWEVMALAAWALISFEHEKAATRRSGMVFFIMSHAGTGLLLLAFLILSQASGSLDFASFHQLASRLSASQQATVFLLFFLGFGVKAGVIPLHVWLPQAHPVAPSNISALMSGIVIKTGIYGMALVFFDFFGAPPVWAGLLVLAAGVVSALLGVLYALMEHDLKRLLAYHSIENIGIILIGFGAAMLFRASGHATLAAIALIAGLYHTLNHAIFKCLLFLGAGSVLQSTRHAQPGGDGRADPPDAGNGDVLSDRARWRFRACRRSTVSSASGSPIRRCCAGFGSTQTLTRLVFPDCRRAARAHSRAGGGVFRESVRHLVSWRCHEAKRPTPPGSRSLPDARGHGHPGVALRGAGARRDLVPSRCSIRSPQHALGVRASAALTAANGLVLIGRDSARRHGFHFGHRRHADATLRRCPRPYGWCGAAPGGALRGTRGTAACRALRPITSIRPPASRRPSA